MRPVTAVRKVLARHDDHWRCRCKGTRCEFQRDLVRMVYRAHKRGFRAWMRLFEEAAQRIVEREEEDVDPEYADLKAEVDNEKEDET